MVEPGAGSEDLQAWSDRVWAELERLPRSDGWAYDEPEGAAAIEAALPGDGTASAHVDPEILLDRIHGAWLGRCAGCVLGKPLEGWPSADIERYLRLTDSWPPDDYVAALDPMPREFPPIKPSWPESIRGRIAGMPRDDDVDYTLLGLHLLEDHGAGAGATVLADELLDHVPFTQVFTAERVAYANLVAGRSPSDAGGYRNPYREWIGALIRSDIHGMVVPGDPRRAALFAMQDALLTHRTNGVYAAMWAAATLSLVLAGTPPLDAVRAALRHVPPRTRTHAAVAGVLADRERGHHWEREIHVLHARHNEDGWVHAVPNVAAIAAALAWGEGDLGRTIGFALAVGWDTDSAAATAGSIVGGWRGASALPASWTNPLDDRIRSSVRGFDGVAISEVAKRTCAVAQRLMVER